MNNWRLHDHYIRAVGSVAIQSEDKNEAKDCVTLMLNTVKAKSTSVPVKKLITEKLAEMIA